MKALSLTTLLKRIVAVAANPLEYDYKKIRLYTD